MTFLLRLSALAFSALLAISAPAIAQDGGDFSLELNNASDSDTGGCRMTFVASNNTGLAFSETSFQVAVFDANGVVSRILVLDFGPLIVGKTKVVLFELGGQGCADISRMIINDVAQCALADGSGQSSACLGGLATSSRTSIQFGI